MFLRKSLLFLLVGFFLATQASSTCIADEPGFVSLFDGKTLEGWEGNLKMFRVEDGAIVAGSLSEKIPNNEFLCSKRQYGDFELRLEARLRGEGDNAGVQFRSQRIPDHFEVSGYQCDIGEMRGKPIWGWLYDESRRKKFLAEADADKLQGAVKSGGWNDLVIRCQGPHIEIWVNGLRTVDYTEADAGIARRGILGLQIHGGPPAEARYRNIRLKRLSDDDVSRAADEQPIAPEKLAPVQASAEDLQLIYAGDMMLADLPGEAIARGVDPFSQFAGILKTADATIGNLECVVATGGEEVKKPYVFRASPEVLPVLK